MEENNNQNNEKLNTEDIKREAMDTANEVKETLKNTDIKKDVNATKGFISNFFKNPINELETVANSKNQFLKIAIIVFAVWIIVTFIENFVSIIQSFIAVSGRYASFGSFLSTSMTNVGYIIKAVLAPILSLAILSLIIYFMQKGQKKPFIQVVSSVMIAKIPVVLATVVGLLQFLGNQVYKITNPFAAFCSIISTVLLYFTIKALYSEKDDNKFIKKFAIIMGIFYIVKFIISFIGIYI